MPMYLSILKVINYFTVTFTHIFQRINKKINVNTFIILLLRLTKSFKHNKLNTFYIYFFI